LSSSETFERPKPVSSWYWLDWQYVLSTGRLPAFKPVAVVLTAMPLLNELTSVIPIKTNSFWLIWVASVSSLFAFATTYIFCPRFVREYERYDDYAKVGHSHRWIGWLLYNNRCLFKNRQRLFEELIEKQIALRASALLDPDECYACPAIFPTSGPLTLMQPVNANRDLFIGMRLNGDRYVIPLQEADPNLSAREKELFWIIYTNLTSTRKPARLFVWFLFATSGVLLTIALLRNVAQPIEQLLERHNNVVHLFGEMLSAVCR
jgi:hypothetical protein